MNKFILIQKSSGVITKTVRKPSRGPHALKSTYAPPIPISISTCVLMDHVTKCSLKKVISKSTSELTPEKDHTLADTAKKSLQLSGIEKIMSVGIFLRSKI